MKRQINGSTALDPIASIKAALGLLLEAANLADRHGKDVWQFALSIDDFRSIGVSSATVLSLTEQGLIGHARELTRNDSRQRRFAFQAGLRVTSKSCFALTEKGCAVAEQRRSLVGPADARLNQSASPASIKFHTVDDTAPPTAWNHVPVWDQLRRSLYYGNCLVKRFMQPANNQEAVLNAFQNDGWPPRIRFLSCQAASSDGLPLLPPQRLKTMKRSLYFMQPLSPVRVVGLLTSTP